MSKNKRITPDVSKPISLAPLKPGAALSALLKVKPPKKGRKKKKR